jgi:hypothetical protein
MKFEPSYLRLRTGSRKPRVTACEPLESRIALSATADWSTTLEDLVTPLAAMNSGMDSHGGNDSHDGHTMHSVGVMVTPTEIITPMETIPRFAANPTITAVHSGNWSDPSVWSLGRTPRAGDRVLIGEHQVITYDVQSNAAIDSIEISGTLQFNNRVNTRLLVANLTVMSDGHLIIGTSQAPIQANVTAELVFADKPIDIVKDPKQLGTGLIALGEVTIYGTAKARTWTRLAQEPQAGSRYLWLSEPVTDWKPGDTVVLPDTRQVPSSRVDDFLAGKLDSQREEMTIQSVFGQLVILNEPLKYSHKGARSLEGQLEVLPHVAVLDRNVKIRSENPNGTRGHTLYTARADVEIAYAQFSDMGRTDGRVVLDNTTFDANGNVKHVGTNQVGRYAVHFHHLLGPENPTNTGYQFKFIGNTVQNSTKWAVAVHGTSFGLLERNVVYGAQGSGFVTEDGTEIGNQFINNIAMNVQGTNSDGDVGTSDGNYGRGGVGFWFRRGGNYLVGNVAADNSYGGFVFSGYNLTNTGRLPLFRGADTHDPAQSRDGLNTPETIMQGNEAYGMTRYGLWAAFINGKNLTPNQAETLITDLKLWHIHSRYVWAYHVTNVTFDNLLILGDMGARDRNDTGPTGMYFAHYEAIDITVRNSRIENMYLGIQTPTNDGTMPGIERPTVIENSVLRNYINIQVLPSLDGMPSVGSTLIVRDVKFEMVTILPTGPKKPSTIPQPGNIVMKMTGSSINYTGPTVVRVYNYNQVKGDNFQVFFHEQAANYVLPVTERDALQSRTRATIGVPEAGLTNAQAWSKYGLALAGAVAPSSARASRPEINGLVGPIQAPPAVPRIVLITPWDNSTSPGTYARLRYNVIGLVPEGAKVYFKLDGGKPFSSYDDGGIFGVSPGNHTLVAYFGDDDGNPIKGLPQTTVRFRKT